MTAKEKHKYIVYGRVLGGVTSFSTFVILAVSAAFTHTLADKPFLLGIPLVLSVLLLPRHTVPRSDEIELADDEREHYQSMNRWLIWLRVAILAVALAIYFVLPEFV